VSGSVCFRYGVADVNGHVGPFWLSGSSLAAGKISSPWTPASSGPPADTNGSGSDSKNLDVGDEVSDEVTCEQHYYYYYYYYYLHSSTHATY
jgi:hypothetical protein